MNSTVQQTVYLLPTARRATHPSQPPRTTAVNLESTGRRPCTTLTLPTTASLPKKGQVKLTSLHEQNQQKLQKNEESGGRVQKRQRSDLGRVPVVRNTDTTQESYIRGLTIGDIQSAIDTEFPETQGLAFNKASHYIRTATTELMRSHSRLSGEASLPRAPPTKPKQPNECLATAERATEADVPCGRQLETSQTASNADTVSSPVNIHVPTS
ncbi:uncharacterized protein [Watersipora subatra]|uniref:uncharacterized protein n=1 Tax=Watersipora subatra TaxID=2589382 RepID=UPI00355B73BE